MLGTLSKAIRKDTVCHSFPGAKVEKEGMNKEKVLTHLLREGGRATPCPEAWEAGHYASHGEEKDKLQL